MGQLKEEFLEAEADLTEARRKLRETEMQSFKKAREGFEEELSKTKMELAATEHLLANYQKEAVTFDTGMQTMERQIDGKPGARDNLPTCH
jgi:chromosome segregation ATPase